MEYPPYTYVPGGPWPHPRSHPSGHSYHTPAFEVPPIDPRRWQENDAYLEGFRLFDAGYYWEAHEVWESLWHAAGRRGPVADFLKALIKIAAAGVKVRERRPGGVRTHADRASKILQDLREHVGEEFLGHRLRDLVEFTERAKLEIALLDIRTLNEPALVVFERRLLPA